MNFNKIFFGSSTAKRKKFLFQFLKERQPKFKAAVFPGCGDFQMVMVAAKAGVKNIIASDVSLYSDTIGAYIMGEDPPEFSVIQEVGFDFDPKDHAEILLFLKAVQLYKKADIYHHRRYLKDLGRNFSQLKADVAGHLENYKQIMAGIQYRHACFYKEFDEFENDPDTFIFFNPPVFGSYSQKVFSTEGVIEYKTDYREFDYKKDFPELIPRLQSARAHVIYVSYLNKFNIDPQFLIFAESKKINQVNYLASNRPVEKRYFLDKSYLRYERFRKRIFTEQYTDEIGPDTTLEISKIKPQMALYLRDLFVHKMGAFEGAGADIITAFWLNKKLIGICGLDLRKLIKDGADYIFEMYAMSVHNSRYHFNNLIMRCITRQEFARLVLSRCKNRCLLRPKKIRTVCLTRFRKLKTSVGVLDLVEREKINDIPTYKLTYEAVLKKDGIKAAYKEWLDAQNDGFGRLRGAGDIQDSAG